MKLSPLSVVLLILLGAGCTDVNQQSSQSQVKNKSDLFDPREERSITEPIRSQPKTIERTAPEPVQESNCDPNYSGCVPIASDVDCAGGSGNGPAYVRGPVRVLGYDKYGLDRDGDGIGCE